MPVNSYRTFGLFDKLFSGNKQETPKNKPPQNSESEEEEAAVEIEVESEAAADKEEFDDVN
jgi:hypothetical protein